MDNCGGGEEVGKRLNPIAESILSERYYLPGEDWEGLCKRVATAVAKAEKPGERQEWRKRFFELMYNLDFLPNSPTLMNAGTELGMLSACFVLPIRDSMKSIFQTLMWTALIHMAGGGTGFNFSALRPEGAPVRSTNGVASGVVSFMKVYNAATDVIKQGGKRRGANMGILDYSHPEIEKFVKCKDDGRELQNFNISVMIKDVEMKKGGEIFDQICYQAWKNGEPGLLFYDSINFDNTVSHLGDIKATNPCSEVPMLPFESCNLGSINLVNMLDKYGEFDYDKFKYTVDVAVRFLDDVISVNKFPLRQIANRTTLTRRIGLGVMGYHDMLIKMGIPYTDKEALQVIDYVGGALNDVAVWASSNLASERGVFPAYPGSIWDEWDMEVRNCTVTSIAPTGTLSKIAGVSSGIEPNFSYSMELNILDRTFTWEHWALSDKSIDKELLETTHDIPPEVHLITLAEWQSNIQNGVSKTINLPHDATVDDVKFIYRKAWELGVKGVTVYRDGSRGGQPIKKCDDPEKCTL